MTTGSLPIGIDLGTTTSCVAVYRNEKVEVIQNKMGNYITPSYVSYAEGKELIGEVATQKLIKYPECTFYDVKRLIGRRYKDESVQNDIKLLSYKSRIKERITGSCIIEIKEINKVYTIEQISSKILSYMKKIAESLIGQKVTDAVITVPAYFNAIQREATKKAGEIAGLNVLRIINEPTSAAIAFKLNNLKVKNKYALIFDLGGGTFDVSILLINQDDITVIKTKGISHLGGIDFDERLLNLCIKLFKEKTNIDLSDNEMAVNKIRKQCEDLKKALSDATEAYIDIEKIIDGKNLSLEITRSQFEECCEDFFDKCINCVEEVIQESKLDKNDIDYIIQVGGSSNIPKTKQILQEYFNREELSENICNNKNEAVAIGAAYQAASIKGLLNNEIHKQIILIDIVGISIGIDKNGKMEKIFSNTTIIPNNKTIILENEKNEKDLIFKMYQGENDDNNYNYFLREFKIENIGKNDKFEITFKISVDSIITVYAKKIGDDRTFLLGEKKVLTKNDINRIEKLIQEQKNKEQKNINAKIELLKLCLKENNNNNLNVGYVYNWIIQNPNASYEQYKEMEKELYNTLDIF